MAQAARIRAAHAGRARRFALIGNSRKVNLVGRAAQEHAGGVPLDRIRQRAQVARGHAQILDEHADVVLIVADQGIEPLRRVGDALDHAVQVAVVRELAQASADRRGVVDRLLEPRVGEEPVEAGGGRVDPPYRLLDWGRGQDPVDALEGSVGVLEHVAYLCGELRTGTSSTFLSRSTMSVFRFRPSVLMSASLRLARKVWALAMISPVRLARRARRVLRGPRKTERRVFNRVEEVEREVLLTGDASELGLGA